MPWYGFNYTGLRFVHKVGPPSRLRWHPCRRRWRRRTPLSHQLLPSRELHYGVDRAVHPLRRSSMSSIAPARLFRAVAFVRPWPWRLAPYRRRTTFVTFDNRGKFVAYAWIIPDPSRATLGRLTLALSGRPSRFQARGRRRMDSALAARRSVRLHGPLERVVRLPAVRLYELAGAR
jgi:hypothetical protein